MLSCVNKKYVPVTTLINMGNENMTKVLPFMSSAIPYAAPSPITATATSHGEYLS
ncbi:hypothetical protein D3C78_1206850 [compost metagenome]